MSSERNVKQKIRDLEKKPKKTAPIPDHDDLTIDELAARVGISISCLKNWLQAGIIPSPKQRPRKKSLFKYMKRQDRHRFSRKYAETLRDCLITRKSSSGFSSLEKFKELCYWRLRKCI